MARAREKDAAEDYRTLSITALQRERVLLPGNSLEWVWRRDGEKVASIGMTIESRHLMRLRYQSRRHGSTPTQHDYPVTISWTPCHLGGERPWLHCPHCSRRVVKLYGGTVFACRHCMRLNYRSQKTSKRDRAIDRAWTLRHRLGCDAGLCDLPAKCIPRPKGMHHTTFARRIEQLSSIEEQVLVESEALLASLERRTDKPVRL